MGCFNCLPHLDGCCICIPLKLGCMIIALLSMFLSQVVKFLWSVCANCGGDVETAMISLSGGLCVIVFFVSLAFLIGIFTGSDFTAELWMWTMFISVLIGLAMTIGMIVAAAKEACPFTFKLNETDVKPETSNDVILVVTALTLAYVVSAVFWMYCIAVVNSFKNSDM